MLFASEMIGAVRGVDPETGHRFDDTKYLLDSISSLSDADRRAIYGGNALRVFGRLEGVLKSAAKSGVKSSGVESAPGPVLKSVVKSVEGGGK